mgnify:CR=1 FL=1
MSENLTTANLSLNSDLETNNYACFKAWDMIIFGMNVLSLAINTFHLVILLRLESLRGTKYRHVLINLSLADIVNVIGIASFYSCYDRSVHNYIGGELSVRLPFTMFLIHITYICYPIFLVASVEKYLAICKPYSYQTSIIVRRLPLVFGMTWLFVFLISTSLAIAVTHSTARWVNGWQFRMLETTALAVLPNIFTVVLLTKVGRELKRMRNQSATVTDNGEEKKAAMYLIIIFIMEMIVFLLNTACITVIFITGNSTVCKIFNSAFKAPHTIANTVIYGWRTKAYQQHVQKMFGCKPSRISNAGR